MKKFFTVLLCAGMLLSALCCCPVAGDCAITDDEIEQMTQMYLDMDIDAMIEMMRGHGMDEHILENMREMHTMAKEGRLGDYLRGFNASTDDDDSESQAPIGDRLYDYTGGVPYLSALNLGIAEVDNPPDTKKALQIAKKYYDMCLPKMESDLKADFLSEVNWTLDFTGKETDPAKATSFSLAAVLTQRMTDAAYFYAALNAAVFALDPNGAAGAINLATAIATAGEDLEAKGTAGIDKDEFYRDALSMYCHALNVCELWEGEHVITVLTSVGALLWDMGCLAEAEIVLSAATEMDPLACDAFDLLYNLYVSANRYNRARELLRKSPTRPLYMAVKTTRDANDKNMEQLRGYTQPNNEEDIEAIAEEIDKVELITLADYYGIFDPASATEIRRHAKSMKDMMKGLMPPDLAKDPMFASYGAYCNSLLSGGPQLSPLHLEWSEMNSQLREKQESLQPAYAKKWMNLGMLRTMYKSDYLNPNEMELQMDIILSVHDMIINFSLIPLSFEKTYATFFEMYGIDEAKFFEILRMDIDYDTAHNLINDLFTASFANGANLALPLYEAFRNAAIKAHPAIMVRIMMISDEDVQRYYLAMWEHILTQVTSSAIFLLYQLPATSDLSFGTRKEVAMTMHDPQPDKMSDAARAEGPSNEEILRRRQAYRDFYSGKINENSELYKKIDKEYSWGWNLPFSKVHSNEFITKTLWKLGLGPVSGQFGTASNHIRDATTYSGSIKVGINRKVGEGVKVGAGASGSMVVTIDRNGHIVPDSVEWKTGLEASIKGGPLSTSVGAGYGSDGGYATVKGELSDFGGTVGYNLETTASKGTRLSGDVSISNSPVKDAAANLATGRNPFGDKEDEGRSAGKQEADNYGGIHDRLMKKERTLWRGEYVLQR